MSTEPTQEQLEALVQVIHDNTDWQSQDDLADDYALTIAQAIYPIIRNQVLEECAVHLETAFGDNMASSDLRSMKTP